MAMSLRRWTAALTLLATLLAAAPCMSGTPDDCCPKRAGCSDTAATPCAELAAAPCCGTPAAPNEPRETRLSAPLAGPALAVDLRPLHTLRAVAPHPQALDPLRPLRSVILRL